MILSRAHILLKDDRSDLRIRESGQIPWQIKYKQRQGIAKIRNISVSGMLIETDTSFNPKDECILSFDSDRDAGLYIPQRGRLVWHKKKKFSRKAYLSGIKFLEAEEQVLLRMRSRVQQGVENFVKMRRITMIAGILLCVAFICAAGYLMWFSNGIYSDITTANQRMLGISGQQPMINQSYRNLYRANEVELTAATDKLNIASQLIEEDKAAISLFSQELEATKALLNQTETMLIQANDRNVELQTLVNQKTGQIGFQEPGQVENIATLADANSLISEYQFRIRSIKGEMSRLKNEGRVARAEKSAYIDDQKLLLGNNGYIIQDGQVVQVDEETYQSLSIGQLQGFNSSTANKDVEIDVTFFE